ncbi:MAG: hypothetical protein AAF799_27525 [Myxococcota bacterium]
MVWAGLRRVSFGIGVLALACGGTESTDTTDADLGSTSDMATGSDDEGADSSSTTSPFPPSTAGGMPDPSQTQSCATYVACAAALQSDELEAIEQTYGPDAECWQETWDEANLCDDRCVTGLDELVAEADAAGEEIPAVCDPDEFIPYSRIQGIIAGSCLGGCHEPGGQGAVLDLTGNAYFAIYEVASQQSTLNLIEPGDHEASYFWHKVNGTHNSVGGMGGRMPRGMGAEPLSSNSIDDIADWIDQGASGQ